MIIARYFVVGGAAALVDFSLFALLLNVAQWHWLVCATAGFVVATAFNYLLSIWMVFTSGVRFARRFEVGLVFLVSGVGLAVNHLALWFQFSVLGIDILLAKIVATGVIFFWNFGVRRYFIFRPVAD